MTGGCALPYRRGLALSGSRLGNAAMIDKIRRMRAAGQQLRTRTARKISTINVVQCVRQIRIHLVLPPRALSTNFYHLGCPEISVPRFNIEFPTLNSDLFLPS